MVKLEISEELQKIKKMICWYHKSLTVFILVLR